MQKMIGGSFYDAAKDKKFKKLAKIGEKTNETIAIGDYRRFAWFGKHSGGLDKSVSRATEGNGSGPGAKWILR